MLLLWSLGVDDWSPIWKGAERAVHLVYHVCFIYLFFELLSIYVWTPYPFFRGHTFASPSAVSKRVVVSYWRKYRWTVRLLNEASSQIKDPTPIHIVMTITDAVSIALKVYNYILNLSRFTFFHIRQWAVHLKTQSHNQLLQLWTAGRVF